MIFLSLGLLAGTTGGALGGKEIEFMARNLGEVSNWGITGGLLGAAIGGMAGIATKSVIYNLTQNKQRQSLLRILMIAIVFAFSYMANFVYWQWHVRSIVVDRVGR